jgi:hypothetical protein
VPPTATDTATPTNTAVPPTATDTATPTNTPTASLVKILGAPNSSPEGKLISLSNNAVARGRTYAWVVTKSGVLYASGSAATFSFIPNDNASYIVTLTVRNGAAIIGSDSKTITVTNVAPRAIFGGSASVRTNTSFVLALLLPSDPSSVDRSAGFSYAFDCGDGQGWRIQLSSSIRCQAPATPSTITVQGRITDKDGGVSIYRGTITVRR